MGMAMQYKSIAQIRRENLEAVITHHFGGTAARLAEAIAVEPPAIARVRKLGKWSQGIGDSMARKIEAAAGLPENWLDYPHNDLNEISERFTELSDEGRDQIRKMIEFFARDQQAD